MITYHVLSETEPFSEPNGGAIARWAGNVLRDDDTSVILAPSADDSWAFPAYRVKTSERLLSYSRKPGGLTRHLPWPLHRHFLRWALSALRPLLQQGDNVWVHNRPEFAAALQPIIRRVGARLFLHMHNSHFCDCAAEIAAAIDADQHVFVSRFLEAEARRARPAMGRSAVLYNGADGCLFHPAASRKAGPIRILCVGRLVHNKGIHVFVEAMRLLAERGADARGVVLGTANFGNDTSAETKYVRKLKSDAPANVEFLPYTFGSALADEFRAADIFCCPSIWEEPFGMVNVEAMATGLPVVATRMGGIPEIFENGGALLVPANDAAAIAQAIERLIEHPEERRKIGEAGLRSFRSQFSWSAVRKTYNKLLTEDV
ncbi:MAG TPA: glycosyltransferase family 4 protein [Acidobacteriaceae bacterium]|jgi:spore coat protein SA